MRALCCLATALVVLVMGGTGAVTAQTREEPDIYSTNDFGGVGLLNMRTARFGADGQFEFGASFVEPYRRYYMTWQILPFAEVTFRYTDTTNVPLGGRPFEQSQSQFFKDIVNLRGGGTHLDRAFDFKLKIWGEGKTRPAFAIGLQDTVGTGLFSGEYMVFTKRIADFDVTAGLGWGYFGSRGGLPNPLRVFSGRFDARTADTGEGGQFGFGDFFSGRRVGVFGGVEYFTPIRSLSVKLEYNSADPAAEPLNNPQPESLPINFGVNWRPYEWFDMAVGFERGNSVMVRLALRHNFRKPGLPKVMDPPPVPITPREGRNQQAGTAEARDLSAYVPDKTWLDYVRDDAAVKDRTVTPRYSAETDYKTKFMTGQSGDGPAWSEADFNPSRLVKQLHQAPSGSVRPNKPTTPVGGADIMQATENRGPARDAGSETAEASSMLLSPVHTVDSGSFKRASGPGVPPPPEIRSEKTGIAAGNTVDGLAAGAVDDPDREIAETIFAELGGRGYSVEGIELDHQTAIVYFTDRRFRSFAKNLGRISRILANHLPPEIEVFTLVYVAKGLETSRVTVFRKDVENAAMHRGSPAEILANAEIEDTRLSQSLPPNAIQNDVYPAFNWSLRPDLRQHVGDPDVGLWKADLRLSLSGRLRLRRNLWITAGVSKFVVGDLDELSRSASSALPHVRSDIRRYVQEGRNSIDRLQVDYLFRPGRNLYGRASAGIFETMYGGVSGELLWQRPGSPLALGLDLNWVKKRDFDQDLGFQDYDIVTGHFSVYYDLPFYNMRFATHIGRYLAGDRGATFDLSREFESGIRVGGFFTLTNVSAQEFGEGSFDKGFYMSIPLDMFLLRSSTRHMNFLFRPLTRDGGQQVGVSPRLKGIVAGDQPDEIRGGWDTFMD